MLGMGFTHIFTDIVIENWPKFYFLLFDVGRDEEDREEGFKRD